jgi:hypothetical protein
MKQKYSHALEKTVSLDHKLERREGTTIGSVLDRNCLHFMQSYNNQVGKFSLLWLTRGGRDFDTTREGFCSQ